MFKLACVLQALNFHPQNSSSLLHRLSQQIKYLLGIRPIDASICDTDTILEPGLALLRYLLVAYPVMLAEFINRKKKKNLFHETLPTFVNVALNHKTHDGRLALGHLLSDYARNLGLVLVVL